MTISFYTLGCKLNQAETNELKEKFTQRGLRVIPFCQHALRSPKGEGWADFYVINACAVTQKAEKQTRRLIHRIKRLYPKSRLIVAGCFTDKMLNQEKATGNVDFWIDNAKKSSMDKLLLGTAKKIFGGRRRKNLSPIRTRALIKIQDGCRQFCAYCIIPYLRKKIFNKSVKKIIKEIKRKEEEGFKEVVLVGTNIGEYNDSKYDLVGLLEEILAKTAIPRVRLSSLWPTVVDSRLVKLIRTESRICPHIHLSVQSGCDKILKRMNRNYSGLKLKQIVKKLRGIPDINLTADIIVGFPGESESDWQKTYNFVQSAKFLKIHVFRFSARPGAPAAKYKKQVSVEAKKVRSKKLIELGRLLAREQREKFIGRTMEVLVEGIKGGFWQACPPKFCEAKIWRGFTPNYLKVYFNPVRSSSGNSRYKKSKGEAALAALDSSKKGGRRQTSNGVKSNKNLVNKIVNVKLVELYKDGLRGRILPKY